MIDSLSGKLLEAEEDFAVVDVNGVRFRLEIPTSTHRALPRTGEAVVVRTRMSFNMNEGTFQLFGFLTDSEREVFDVLTAISGIGPRKALMMLSQVEIAPFAAAIIQGDLNYLSRIKGIGKKTAERLVVELREKMAPFTQPSAGGATGSMPGASTLPGSAAVRDAVQALMVLGCRQPVAERAIGRALEVLGDKAPTADLVREGLKHRA